MPLLNKVWRRVFRPPIWSNNKKLIVLSEGLGVSNLCINRVKSCKMALGRPEVPVEKGLNQRVLYFLIALSIYVYSYFLNVKLMLLQSLHPQMLI